MNLYESYQSECAYEFYAYNLVFLAFNWIDFERIMHLIPEALFEHQILKDAL